MKLSVDIQGDASYLVCTISGKWETAELSGFIDTVASESRKQGCRRILADLSMVSGPPGEIERYEIGKQFASAFPGIKTAIVYHKVFDDTFFEDTATNRGAWIKIFSDSNTALQWLLKGHAEQAESG